MTDNGADARNTRCRAAAVLAAAIVAFSAVVMGGCGGTDGDQGDGNGPLVAAVTRHVERAGPDFVFLSGSSLVRFEVMTPVRVEDLRISDRSEIAATADVKLIARVRLAPGPPRHAELGRLIPPRGAVSEARVPARLRLGLDNEGRWGVVDDQVMLDKRDPVDGDARAAAVDHARRAMHRLLTLDPTIRDVAYVDVQAPFYATVPEDRADFTTDAAMGLMPVPDLGGDQTYTTLGGLDGSPEPGAPELLDDLLPASTGDAPSPDTDCTLALRRLDASEPTVDRVTDETAVSHLVERVIVEGTIEVRAATYRCPEADRQSLNFLEFAVTVGRGRFARAPWRVLSLSLRNREAERSAEGVVYDVEGEVAPWSPNAAP